LECLWNLEASWMLIRHCGSEELLMQLLWHDWWDVSTLFPKIWEKMIWRLPVWSWSCSQIETAKFIKYCNF
jgi:hypothetical protein